MQTSSNRWALVLAAGSGTRLSRLTADGSGVFVPKQFCSLAGGSSLLEETLARATTVASPDQTAVVVAAEHRRFWEGALAQLWDENVIVQPRNRGTANGILLGLSAILERDPNAIVTILPSDHHVKRESVLVAALECAVAAIESATQEAITFLGIAPDSADAELGYIVPGPRRPDGTRAVTRFVEKPPAALAARLVRQGALWNSFIIVARASAIVALIERRFPVEVLCFRSLWRQTRLTDRFAGEAARLYEKLADIDFSRHVVEGADAPLGVVAVPRCGWSDLGTPERVGDALARLGRARTRPMERGPAFRHFNLAEAHARLIGRLASATPQTA